MKKNSQLLVLIGAPGAGKSVFAKYFIRSEENWMRLCRDDFRMMNFSDSLLSRSEENLISEVFDIATETLLNNKCNVLLDATHCRAEYLNHYIKRFNTMADISFKLFECDVEELIARCEKRYAETGRYVPESVIRRFVEDLEVLKTTFDFSPRPLLRTSHVDIKQDANLQKAIICDLDGTLALIGNRNPYDASKSDEDSLNEAVACVLKLFAANGYSVLLLSGREEIFREPTLRFLTKFAIPCQHLWMRRTKDYRKDAVVKREIFDREIAGKYYVEFVLDDRDQVVKMWRHDLQLSCFQVNYGNF
jgi:predicted kinase